MTCVGKPFFAAPLLCGFRDCFLASACDFGSTTHALCILYFLKIYFRDRLQHPLGHLIPDKFVPVWNSRHVVSLHWLAHYPAWYRTPSLMELEPVEFA